MIARLILIFYSATLVLLPWCWLPPFPWLHEHAQWSDVTFAITALLWGSEKLREREWPRWQCSYVAAAGYVVAATLSLLLAASDKKAGTWKLPGITELIFLFTITSDLASRHIFRRWIGWSIVITAILTATAALTGLLLFYADVPTRLIGHYGDLQPSAWYVRVQAGTYHPNLLASFCIFAAAVIAREQEQLPTTLRRLAQAALVFTVLLTFSRGILAFGLAAAIRNASTRRQRLLTSLYAIASITIIAALTIWNLSVNPARPLATYRDSQEQSSRWHTATSSLRTLAAHPVWGTGTGTHPGEYRGMPFDAHLTPLNIAATMGLPALCAFAGLIVLLWRGRSRPTDIFIWSGLAGMGLDALASDIEDFRHLWVLFGLAAAANASGRNDDEELQMERTESTD